MSKRRGKGRGNSVVQRVGGKYDIAEMT